MPQIEEYLPQISAPEGLGGVSPNTEFAGTTGRGLEKLGGDIAQAAQVITEKNVQQESADVYAHIADQRALWTTKLQQQTQDGSLNVNKFMEDYENSMTDFDSNLSTRQAKNFLERQQARLKGSLLQQASFGAAQVASNAAKGQWQTGINQNSAALMKDPSSFEDVYHSSLETIDDLIKNGGLPEKMRSKAELEMGKQFSEAAIRGWAEQDPDKAKHMVDEGGFDQFLNSDDKHKMLMEIKQYAKADSIEDSRAQKAVEKAQKATEEKWYGDNFEKITNNAMPAKDVIQAVKQGMIRPEKGEQILNVIKANSKEDLKTNPHVFSDLLSRVTDPNSLHPITSPDDPALLAAVSQGKLAVEGPHSLVTLKKAFNQTPEGQKTKMGEKALHDLFQTVKFKDPFGGNDARGVQNANQAMMDYYQAKSEYVAKGGQASDLLDPSNKNYFGRNIDHYRMSITDRLQHQGDSRVDKAMGLRPTGTNPNPVPVKEALRPGESLMDNLRRNGDFK